MESHFILEEACGRSSPGEGKGEGGAAGRGVRPRGLSWVSLGMDIDSIMLMPPRVGSRGQLGQLGTSREWRSDMLTGGALNLAWRREGKDTLLAVQSSSQPSPSLTSPLPSVPSARPPLVSTERFTRTVDDLKGLECETVALFVEVPRPSGLVTLEICNRQGSFLRIEQVGCIAEV